MATTGSRRSTRRKPSSRRGSETRQLTAQFGVRTTRERADALNKRAKDLGFKSVQELMWHRLQPDLEAIELADVS
jgi:uncharacterized protein with GYD domain